MWAFQLDVEGSVCGEEDNPPASTENLICLVNVEIEMDLKIILHQSVCQLIRNGMRV